MTKIGNRLSREPAIDGEDFAMATRATVIKADQLHLADLRREHGSKRWPNRILVERSTPARFSAVPVYASLYGSSSLAIANED
jgi:hypothetical protein